MDVASLAARGPALLFFYKGDCSASEAAAHVLPRLAAVAGLAVLAISQDGPEDTDAFSRAHRLAAGGVRMIVDPEPWPASVEYGVAITPTFVLLAPGGKVEARFEAWSRDDANALAAKAAALVGAPAPVVSTAADGPTFQPG
jgi:hypothetical protein